LTLSTFVNYIDNYDNEGVINLGTRVAMPAATIDSWTTVDLNIGYGTGNRSSEWISDLRMLLSVRNALDANPPAYEDGAWGYGYDPANADPLGRVISLTVSKAW
jgi:outer membrane receptor protein involved in Fe transport